MPNAHQPVRYRTECVRRRRRITAGQITAGAVVLVAMAGFFLVLVNL